MFPTIVNAVAVFVGALVGLGFHGRISERYRTILFQALGLVTLLIGMKDAMQTQSVPLLALSMIAGGLIGEAIDIDKRFNQVGEWLKHRFAKPGDHQFVDSFVYTSLLFCVGAMTVVGSFRAGVQGDGEILYTKSLMDGHAAIFLASGMGAGVLASSLTVLVVQGGLTLLFMLTISDLPETVVTEVGAAGGLLIAGIGLMLLDVVKIRLANLLPSMFVAGLLAWALLT
ncbi:MAG: DUF554 domain-containing protein [Candidatus Hinthialibacter antarcticus]|nr:DUF554 domain-containing protein [Candidatus Hinthialibacter antarcticus]